jgi:hypothetical protein
MKQGTCHAANSSQIVQRVCIGQKECSIPATNDLFGDPCKFFFEEDKDLFRNENNISYILWKVTSYEMNNLIL